MGIGLILLYTSSTLYHAVRLQKSKKIFQIADHSAIYIKLPAPILFSLITLKDNYGWIILIIIWTLAVAGVIFKFFFTDRLNIISTIIYLAMGWLCVVVLKLLFEVLPLNGFIFLAVGGISYTVGVIFFLWEKLLYSHPIWHLFVLGGSIFHYFTILFYLT
jgi:hemolysin III